MEDESEHVASSETLSKPLFRDITADDYDPEITEIESLCMNCEEQGMTRLFLTKIPFFREVIVSSFSCDECGCSNAELQPGGRIQDRGVSYKLTMKEKSDLNRQVVQTQYATVKIPQLEFEIPPGKSVLTTVEGIIDRAVDGLEQDQVLRRIQHPEVAEQIDSFVLKLKGLKDVETSWQMIVEDPSGNSFVENPYAPQRDHQLIVAHFARTRAQDQEIGLSDLSEERSFEENPGSDGKESSGRTVGQNDGEGFNTQNEVLSFPTNCPNCSSPCDTNMKLVNIPFFKEVIIMATVCDRCGHRDNEVKSSGGIAPKGQVMSLEVNTPEDMARDVLKSETAALQIPELDFDMEPGTLGGKFTTVEGLLMDVKNQLSNNPFFGGDSSQASMSSKLHAFCQKLDDIISGKIKGYHFVLDDPAGNSFIQSLCAPDPDPQLEVSQYQRTWQHNEEMGINDMNTENYEET
ncbi:hypothetical protein EGW08_019521 [Elysia chlorotica]|uniref:Zinc finger protein ZPR1 n=1 Tax=Elysia chlorotica TaxID=188477 RepID=A0A3S0ZQ67_ELYCH|nr:hypothetical protein EGW08_019521 [Elysia chlorotica]